MIAARARGVVAALVLLGVLGFGVGARATPDEGLRPLPAVARVVDEVGLLQPDERRALEGKLAQLETQKGSQWAVVIVATTQPEVIEQYGIRLADAWKLGRQGVDDGVLLIIATQDHHFRWEVGRGLEGAITDLGSARISDEYLRPAFRQGNFYGGIDRALDKAMGLLNGEPLPPPPQGLQAGHRDGAQSVLSVLAFAIFAGLFFRTFLGRLGGALVAAILAGAIVHFVLGILALSIVVGLVAFFPTLLLGLGGVAGFYGGGSGGAGLGGGLGGGGGGGGFSGGGGGFGGGGSSGSW